MIRFEWLESRVAADRARFQSAQPFAHLVWDDFLEEEAAEACRVAFPPLEAMTIQIRRFTERKAQESRWERLPPPIRALHTELASPRFLQLLTAITGIEDLTADPELIGGGIHQGGDKSFLHIHADFNVHPTTGLYRRLNILLYLNRGWRPEYGGALELWNADMTAMVVAIPPVFNRCVLIETHDTAYHGYSMLHLPPGETRKSVAAYYYAPRPHDPRQRREHSTLFRARPQERHKDLAFRLFGQIEAAGWPLYRRLRTLRQVMLRKR
jgi:hypothetical protein